MDDKRSFIMGSLPGQTITKNKWITFVNQLREEFIMRIGASTGTHSTANHQVQNTSNTNQDSRMKAIQDQITNVQQQLQSLSNNDGMSAEAKKNKRTELEQQLQDLNRQMMQRKTEIQQEKMEKAAAESDTRDSAQDIDGQKSAVMGTASMQSLISADASMKQVNSVQAVKTDMEGKAGVLEIEIKLDSSRGGSTAKKAEELANLNGRIHDATAGMMNKISDIKTTLEESKEDDGAGDEEKKDKVEEGNQKAGLIEADSELAANKEGSEASQAEPQENSTQQKKNRNQEKGQYVDVKL